MTSTNQIISQITEKSSIPEEYFLGGYWEIYVTLYGTGEIRGVLLACQSSQNPNPNEAIREAAQKCFSDKRFFLLDDYVVVLTVIKEGVPFNHEKFILGEHAISCQGATFKEAVAVTKGFNTKKFIWELLEKANTDTLLPIYMHKSTSYMNGKPLYYAHTRVTNLEDIEERITLAGEFIARSMKYTGEFIYGLNPVKGWFEDDNNIVRQLATLWVFCKWVNQYNRVDMIPFCIRGLNYAHNLYRSDFLGEEKKLAFYAFLLLATLQSELTQEICALQDEIVSTLLAQQNKDGSFNTIIGEIGIARGINYYPPEALYALSEYASIRNVPVDAIERGFEFYSEYYRKNPHTAPVSWMSLAFGERVAFMCDYLVSLQNERGYFNDRADVSSCTFAEALAVHGRKKELEKALLFTCQLQYKKGDLYYLEDDFCLGGVRKSLTDSYMRVDFTQHHLHSLLLAKGIL